LLLDIERGFKYFLLKILISPLDEKLAINARYPIDTRLVPGMGGDSSGKYQRI